MSNISNPNEKTFHAPVYHAPIHLHGVTLGLNTQLILRIDHDKETWSHVLLSVDETGKFTIKVASEEVFSLDKGAYHNKKEGEHNG